MFQTARAIVTGLLASTAAPAMDSPAPIKDPVPIHFKSGLTKAPASAPAADPPIADLKDGKVRLADLPQSSRGDPATVLAALAADWKQIDSASADLRASREFMTRAVGINGNVIKGASEDLRNDKEFVTLAVRKNEEAFQYASQNLKRDRPFIFSLCVEKDLAGGARFRTEPFGHADVRVRTDKDFVLSLLKEGCSVYHKAPDWIRASADVAALTFAKNGIALKFAPESVKDDPALVAIAVRKSPQAIAFASPRLQKDRNLNFLVASLGDERTIEKCVHADYRTSETFAQEAFARNKLAYVLLPASLKENQRNALEYINVGIVGYPKLPPLLQGDIEFLSRAVQHAPLFYSSLPESLKKNHQIILAGASIGSHFLNNVPLDVLTDSKFQAKLALTSLTSKSVLLKAAGEISREALLNYEKLEKAYAALKIHSGGYKTAQDGIQPRFDNSRAIIEGRYQVSNEETRNKLEQILGKSFFENVLPVHLDKRPLAVILMATSDAEGSLAQGGPLNPSHDNVDQLTCDHRVVFYQVSSKEELKASGIEATGAGQYRAKVATIWGHGAPGSMMLTLENFIGVEDLEFLKPMFLGLMGENSVIVWGSCSFGDDTVDGDNFVKSVHLMCPSATMYAMRKPGNLRLKIGLEGEFGAPDFFNKGAELKDDSLLIIRGLRPANLNIGNTPDAKVTRALVAGLKRDGAYFAQGKVLDYSVETNSTVELNGIHAFVDGALVTKMGSSEKAIALMVDSCVAKRFATILESKETKALLADWNKQQPKQVSDLATSLKRVLGYEDDIKIRYKPDAAKKLYTLTVTDSSGVVLVNFNHGGDRYRITLERDALAKGIKEPKK